MHNPLTMKLAALVFCVLASQLLATSTLRLGEGDISLTVPELTGTFSPGPEKNISGQVFIRSRGGETFKLSAVSVYIYPSKLFLEYEKWVTTQGKRRVLSFLRRSENLTSAGQPYAADSEITKAKMAVFDNWGYLPKAPYMTKTDADGRFAIVIKTSDPFTIVARSTRLVGKETEYYIWTIPSTDAPDGIFMLSHDNNR